MCIWPLPLIVSELIHIVLLLIASLVMFLYLILYVCVLPSLLPYTPLKVQAVFYTLHILGYCGHLKLLHG